MKPKITIIGAGSWGTAVAIHLARNGHEVMLWDRNKIQVEAIASTHLNERYLPGISLSENIQATTDLAFSTQWSNYWIIAVPSHAFGELIHALPQPKTGIAWLTKGIDPQRICLLDEVITEHWGKNVSLAAISGPSFAREVARQLPTALTVAGNNESFIDIIRSFFHHHQIRVYKSSDLVGVQLCGAIKNVLAIACGVSDGLHYGANAKAALITRGLTEMRRLGKSMGAKDESFMGLAGVGDLVLTCTDDQSRNRRFGLLLGQGLSVHEAEQQIGQVVEGKYNANQVCCLAMRYGIEMPICKQVNQVLQGIISPTEAAKDLMSRNAGMED